MGTKELDLNHSVVVASVMFDIALERTGDIEYAKQMHALGLLHDIGKTLELGKDGGHEVVGGLHMGKHGYKYWREIFWHGTPNCVYRTKELDILNTADLCVMSNGSKVSPLDRIEDICERYGVFSQQYMNAMMLFGELFKLEEVEAGIWKKWLS